jgi:ankyrin repeat protein
MSPLHWASFNGHLNVTSLLLEYGADINAVDNVRIFVSLKIFYDLRLII